MKPTKLKPGRRLLILTTILLLSAFMLEGMVILQRQLDLFPVLIGPSSPGYVVMLGASLIFLLAIVDAAISWLPARIDVTRTVPKSVSLGKWTDVSLLLRSAVSYEYSLSLRDAIPSSFLCRTPELSLSVKPDEVARISYKVKPLERGEHHFRGIHMERLSVLKLWRLNYFLDAASEVRVYPNFSAVAGYSLLHADHQSSQLGIKKKVRRGEGMDFLQLREYREGDSLRQIDWKASSRYQKLISQEYQDARDQQVMIMLDSGRRMRTKDGELSHFDHSLNATILLAHIALKQGDSVSVLGFGGQDRYVAPFKGTQNIQHLLNEMYDLYPSNEACDYIEAAKSAVTLNRKRSLVVIATNLRDEDLDDLSVAVKLLQKKHLVLVANLLEEAVEDVLQQPVNTFSDAIRYTGVHSYHHQTHQAMERLKSLGVWLITCRPSELSIQMVNSYLQIKHSGVL